MVSNSKFSLFAFTAQLDANLPAFLPLISYCLPSLNHASFILTAAPDSPSFMSFSYLFLCHLCCCLWCLEWPYWVLCLKELAFPVAQKALKMQTKERSHLEPMSTWACYDQIILLLDFIPFPHSMGQHATFCVFSLNLALYACFCDSKSDQVPKWSRACRFFWYIQLVDFFFPETLRNLVFKDRHTWAAFLSLCKMQIFHSPKYEVLNLKMQYF